MRLLKAHFISKNQERGVNFITHTLSKAEQKLPDKKNHLLKEHKLELEVKQIVGLLTDLSPMYQVSSSVQIDRFQSYVSFCTNSRARRYRSRPCESLYPSGSVLDLSKSDSFLPNGVAVSGTSTCAMLKGVARWTLGISSITVKINGIKVVSSNRRVIPQLIR